MVLPSSAFTLTAMPKFARLAVKVRCAIGRSTLMTDRLLAMKDWLNAGAPCDQLLWETFNVTFMLRSQEQSKKRGKREGWLSVGVVAQWQSADDSSQRPWVWSPAVPPFFLSLCRFKGLRTVTAPIFFLIRRSLLVFRLLGSPVHRTPHAVIMLTIHCDQVTFMYSLVVIWSWGAYCLSIWFLMGSTIRKNTLPSVVVPPRGMKNN